MLLRQAGKGLGQSVLHLQGAPDTTATAHTAPAAPGSSEGRATAAAWGFQRGAEGAGSPRGGQGEASLQG